MNKQFIIKALTRLRQFWKRQCELNELGIDTSDFAEIITGVMEEAIVGMNFGFDPEMETDYIYEQLASWCDEDTPSPEEFLEVWSKDRQ